MRIRPHRSILAALIVSAAAARTGAVEVLIPSYFYPVTGSGNLWPQLNTAASSVGITAILNPASGPTATVDTRYNSAVNSLRSNGGRVIAYVSTVYGTRPIADVKADIAKYKSQYSLDGIFLDEMTNENNAANLSYYKDVYAYIKSIDPNYRVTGNPGTNTQPAYITGPAADTLVTFETNTGYLASTPSAWTTSYATRRFSNLAYDIPTSAGMVSAVNAAVTKRAGYIYVTDDNGANPWDTLPTYWSAELDAIRAVTPTWANSSSGDWNTTTNWTTAAAPNAVGAEAFLFGAIASAQTVYTNSAVTLGSLVFNNANRYVLTGAGTLTLDASVETALVDVRRGDHTINLPLILKDATIASIAGASSLTIADPLTIAAGASLTKTGSGTLAITSLVSNAATPLAVAAGMLQLSGESSVDSLAIEPGATLVLGKDSQLTVTGDGPQNAIRAALRSARAAGDWSGVGLIAIGVDDHTGIGFAAMPNDTLAVRLAANGDTNLDGAVNFSDLLTLAKSRLQKTDAFWSDGDFNYDGVVGSRDLSLLEANYVGDDARFANDWALAQSLVPEPTMLMFTLLYVPLALRRR